MLVFLCIGLCIYKARQYASAVPNERTTVAHVVSVYHSIFRGLRFNYYSCSYNFSVDGSLYTGLRDCPQWIIDYAVKGKYLGSDGVPTGTDATVYYDPADPSVNSLLEFSAEAKVAYQTAVPWICVGLVMIFGYVFSAVLRANQRARRGESVDAGEAVVYPGQAGYAHSPELRDLYLQVVNRIHPDRAWDEADRMLRERLMKQANAAFERGDAGTLREVLQEYRSMTSTS